MTPEEADLYFWGPLAIIFLLVGVVGFYRDVMRSRRENQNTAGTPPADSKERD